MKKKTLIEITEDIIESSIEVALDDGIIDDDEAKLLDIISHSVSDIRTDLEVMLPEVDIDEEELCKRVKLICGEVLNQLSDKAIEDGKVSEEENALIKHIIEKISFDV